MNKKNIIILLSITFLLIVLFFEYKSYKSNINPQLPTTVSDRKEGVLNRDRLEVQPSYIQQFYKDVPILFWKENNPNLTHEELRAEVMRIRELISDRAPFIDNKYAWLVSNLPLNQSPQNILSYNPNKYTYLTQPGRMGREITQQQALSILNLSLSDAQEPIRAVYDQAQATMKTHLIRSLLIELSDLYLLSQARFPNSSPQELEAHLVSEFLSTNRGSLLVELFPEFSMSDFLQNTEHYMQRYGIDPETDLDSYERVEQIQLRQIDSQMNQTDQQEFERQIFNREIE